MTRKQLLSAIIDLKPEARASLLREVDDQVSQDIASNESPEFIANLVERTDNWENGATRATPWEQVNQEMKALLQKINRERGTSKSTRSPKSKSPRPSLPTK